MPRQAEAGVDIGNNGEQQRNSFFLYLKDRLDRTWRKLAAAVARRRRALS